VLIPNDDQIDLTETLLSHYQEGRKDGKGTYVYIYSDENTDCARLRRKLDIEKFRAAFADNQVIMLDFQQAKRWHQARWRWGKRAKNSRQVLVKITDTGNFSNYVHI
jgi:DICT domain-containing protein